MKKSDAVLRELGQLYDFQRKVAEFRFRKKRVAIKATSPDRQTAALRSAAPVR